MVSVIIIQFNFIYTRGQFTVDVVSWHTEQVYAEL